MALIEHNGRKSGRSYQPPVMAFVDGGEPSVVLNYGTESDWVRNVQAPLARLGWWYIEASAIS
jgi:deazaflavin-dependent oxidoreductase (nitroreductase family)